jgi:hypothetical protein
MTMPFPAAAAATLEASTNYLPIGLYSYPTEVQFDVKTVGNRAPAFLRRILHQLQADEPTIVFCNHGADPIHPDAFPTDKATFDEMFSTATVRNLLSCRFEIRSNRKSFHAIKVGVWDILKQSNAWFRKSPGPVKRLPLSVMGFWVKVHPGFASPYSWLAEINSDICENYDKKTDILKQFNLPAQIQPTDMYLARGKFSGQFHTPSANNAPKTVQPITTDALLHYASSDDLQRAMLLLTHISTHAKPSNPQDPIFIPMALVKHSDPMKFGHYLAKQNQFLKDHRNIAIVGAVPELMDLVDNDGFTLWNQILAQPGVFRCDPCARTHDLGKWNVSSALSHNAPLKEFLNGILAKAFANAPASFPQLTIFPALELLSKDRRPNSGQPVASGLTDASPLTH